MCRTSPYNYIQHWVCLVLADGTSLQWKAFRFCVRGDNQTFPSKGEDYATYTESSLSPKPGNIVEPN
jgi:hypothetical protein